MCELSESSLAAFGLVGYIRGAAEKGWLDSAPGWFVEGVQEQLGHLDALSAKARAEVEAVLARLRKDR